MALPAMERLRRAIRDQAAGLDVSEKRRQWAFDDGIEGFCDIDVISRDPRDSLPLVVIFGKVPGGFREDFMVTFWHRKGAEVWILGEHAIQRYPTQDTEPLCADPPLSSGALTTPRVPSLAVDVAALFA
jgi:hypothetical protein